MSFVLLVLNIQNAYSAVPGPCEQSVGTGYQVGFDEDAICFYCFEDETPTGVCLDDEFGETWCIDNNAYDPNCDYNREKNLPKHIGRDYDFCDDGFDNDKDTHFDFRDADCDEEGLQDPNNQQPKPVNEGSTYSIDCPFNPTVQDIDPDTGEWITRNVDFGTFPNDNHKPEINTRDCTFSSWSANTAKFISCPASGDNYCESVQDGIIDVDVEWINIDIIYKTCAAKGGVKGCPVGKVVDQEIPASDPPCYNRCIDDTRDSDGDGTFNYQDFDINNACSKFSQSDNCGGQACNTDTDGDGLFTSPSNNAISGASCDPNPLDKDNDGYVGTTWGGNDCSDNNAAINPAATEICTGGIDENCNSLVDKEDPKCVEITSIDTSGQISQSLGFELECGTTIDSNCVGGKINDDPALCSFTRWDSITAVFTCTPNTSGTINLECYLSNKDGGSCTVSGETATPAPSSKTLQRESLTNVCSSRSQSECGLDSLCEFCSDCSSSNPQFSSGFSSPGSCVDKDSCASRYQCNINQCGAVCDEGSWAGCLGYETCNLNSCGCDAKTCGFNELGQHSTHGETPDEYVCVGDSTSQTWTLIGDVLTEDQYSCNDQKDNDGDGAIDCVDTDCFGLTNFDGLTCCGAVAGQDQPTCDALATQCTSFEASGLCSGDSVQKGSQFTYTCTASICQQNAGFPCTSPCSSNGCCIPGQETCVNEGAKSDIDEDGDTNICSAGDWLGADCSDNPPPPGCTSTDNIDYECLIPSDCSLNTGTCGELTCENNKCGTKKVSDVITKCQSSAITLGYECAITDTDPIKACVEENPGEFNCVYFGDSYECRDTKNPVLGFDAACDVNFQCDKDICNDIADSCSLCYSQCIDVAQNDPSKAPYSVSECEMAKNGEWITSQCTGDPI